MSRLKFGIILFAILDLHTPLMNKAQFGPEGYESLAIEASLSAK